MQHYDLFNYLKALFNNIILSVEYFSVSTKYIVVIFIVILLLLVLDSQPKVGQFNIMHTCIQTPHFFKGVFIL